MEYSYLHHWRVNIKEAKKIQRRLRKRLVLGRPLKNVEVIAAADVSYYDTVAYAVVSVFSYPQLELLESKIGEAKIRFSYIPGLLAFREGPALLSAFKKIEILPEVILFDGQGAAHPLGMGEATHMGILLDRPTIGCAKTRLFGLYKNLPRKRGSYSYLISDRGIVGVALRTQEGAKPIFVSAGFKIDLKSSIEIVLGCTNKYRIPEPLRYVHQQALRISKGERVR